MTDLGHAKPNPTLRPERLKQLLNLGRDVRLRLFRNWWKHFNGSVLDNNGHPIRPGASLEDFVALVLGSNDITPSEIAPDLTIEMILNLKPMAKRRHLRSVPAA